MATIRPLQLVRRASDWFLDLGTPFADPEEKWSDKEYGVRYCMLCGEEAETLTETPLTKRVKCSADDCDNEGGVLLRYATYLMLALGGVVGVLAFALGAQPGVAFLAGVIAAFVLNQGEDRVAKRLHDK